MGKIEACLLKKIESIGTESTARLNIFFQTRSGFDAECPEDQMIQRYPFDICLARMLSSDVQPFGSQVSVLNVWDADKIVQHAPFQRCQQAHNMTDVRSAVLNPGDLPDLGIPSKYLEGHGQHIAILDTSVDITHDQIRKRIESCYDFTEDGNFELGDMDHGTHVCGIANNVAPQAMFLLGKVFDKNSIATRRFIVDAICAMVESGADVINGSWGESDCTGGCPVDRAVSYAVENGCMFVGSAGNSGPKENSLTCPAGNPNIVTVGACTLSGEMAEFSSRGPSYIDGSRKPDVSAPGVDISSCKPGGGYQIMSGTSMSSPVVAGVAAVVRSVAGYMEKA